MNIDKEDMYLGGDKAREQAQPLLAKSHTQDSSTINMNGRNSSTDRDPRSLYHQGTGNLSADNVIIGDHILVSYSSTGTH